jgi:hypothetical protein
MTGSFKTYWLVDGVKVMSYATMKKMIESGKTGIEISAESQFIAAEERKRRAKANAILDEQIRRAAAEREHDQSPEGQREAAKRNALTNPGGIISGGMNPFAELEAFLPHKTSLLR